MSPCIVIPVSLVLCCGAFAQTVIREKVSLFPNIGATSVQTPSSGGATFGYYPCTFPGNPHWATLRRYWVFHAAQNPASYPNANESDWCNTYQPWTILSVANSQYVHLQLYYGFSPGPLIGGLPYVYNPGENNQRVDVVPDGTPASNDSSIVTVYSQSNTGVLDTMQLIIKNAVFTIHAWPNPGPTIPLGGSATFFADVPNQCGTGYDPVVAQGVTYSITVQAHRNLGHLVCTSTRDSGYALSGLTLDDLLHLKYYADADNPDVLTAVPMHITASDTTVTAADFSVYVQPGTVGPPDHFRVELSRDSLSHGDTSQITITAVDANNHSVTGLDFASLSLAIDSTLFGMFMNPSGSIVGSSLANVAYNDAHAGRVRFIANNLGAMGDSSYVKAHIQAVCSNPALVGSALIKVKPVRIMLGETKYFSAQLSNGGVWIRESSAPPQQYSNAVWSIRSSVGRRLGVYYEYRDSTGRPLGGSDRLRIIGRYWSPDTTFVVTVGMQSGSLWDSVRVTVVRPDTIGIVDTDARDVNYNIVTANDINNNHYSLDSLVIFWAGVRGIPPQIVKGVMKQETNRFNPAYRYEPIKDAQLESDANWLAKMRANKYWIDSASHSSGNPQPPGNPLNLRDAKNINISYPGWAGSVYDYSWDHYLLYRGDFRKRTFEQDRSWAKLFDSLVLRFHPAPPDTLALKRRADTLLWAYLRTTYRGGLRNITAQTRIVASYGIMQLVYWFGVTETATGYPQNLASQPGDGANPPEALNSPHVYIGYSTKHLISMFERRYGGQDATESIIENFSRQGEYRRGFDETWRRVLNAYNGNTAFAGSGGCPPSDYGSNIMCWYYRIFTPRKRF